MSLQKSWPQIVGPGISQHSKIMYVKNDRLYIEVDSSTWLNELSFMKEDILRKIKLMISDVLINEIWFKVRIKA